MPVRKDVSGQRFGKLVALRPTAKRERGSVIWVMRCDCGSEVEKSLRRVGQDRARDIVSKCPVCVNYGRRGTTADLTGHRYGKLTVRGYHAGGGGNSGAYWDCLCDCGEPTIVRGKDIRLGTTSSCGCAKREVAAKTVDLPWRGTAVVAGQRYGNLVVVDLDGMRRGMRYFNCTCDCGATATVRGTLLRNGQTKSCGCLKRTAWMRRPAFSRLAA